MTARIRWFGVFNGANYAPSSIAERADVITFPTLEDARDLLRTLQHGDDPSWLMQSGVRTLEGKGLPLMPNADDGGNLMLYAVPDSVGKVCWPEHRGQSSPLVAWEMTYGPSGSVTDPYPDRVVRYGDRGGVIVEEVG